jgi:hypothetical protein
VSNKNYEGNITIEALMVLTQAEMEAIANNKKGIKNE